MFGGGSTLHVGTGVRPGELVPMFDRCLAMFDRCWGVLRGKMSLKQSHLMPVKGLLRPQIALSPPGSGAGGGLYRARPDFFVLIWTKTPCLRCRYMCERYVGGVVGRLGMGMLLRASYVDCRLKKALRR